MGLWFPFVLWSLYSRKRWTWETSVYLKPSVIAVWSIVFYYMNNLNLIENHFSSRENPPWHTVGLLIILRTCLQWRGHLKAIVQLRQAESGSHWHGRKHIFFIRKSKKPSFVRMFHIAWRRRQRKVSDLQGSIGPTDRREWGCYMLHQLPKVLIFQEH